MNYVTSRGRSLLRRCCWLLVAALPACAAPAAPSAAPGPAAPLAAPAAVAPVETVLTAPGDGGITVTARWAPAAPRQLLDVDPWRAIDVEGFDMFLYRGADDLEADDPIARILDGSQERFRGTFKFRNLAPNEVYYVVINAYAHDELQDDDYRRIDAHSSDPESCTTRIETTTAPLAEAGPLKLKLRDRIVELGGE